MTIWVDLLGAQVRFLGRQSSTRVIEAGEGPALLLLHGVGGHAEAFSRNVVRLGRGRRAIAMDLLWHGLSSKPPYVDGQDIPAYAGQVLDLLDAESIEQADLEGESLGGWVGMYLALHHPDRLNRLILNTTAGSAGSQAPSRSGRRKGARHWRPGHLPQSARRRRSPFAIASNGSWSGRTE